MSSQEYIAQMENKAKEAQNIEQIKQQYSSQLSSAIKVKNSLEAEIKKIKEECRNNVQFYESQQRLYNEEIEKYKKLIEVQNSKHNEDLDNLQINSSFEI